MKKYIFYLVTLCICASFLVACSGNDKESDASTEQEEKASSTNDEEEKEETNEEDKEDDNSINKDEEQKIEGNIIVDNNHQEISLKIDTEGNEMETPEDSFVTENDGEFKIQVPDDVLFDFDKSELKSDSKATLDDVTDILEDVDDGIAIEINGHTDNEGETEYNLKLSEERAEEVDKYLTKNGDIDHLSIQTNGYGEEEPIESNAEEEGRERNRRVEIVIENLE